MNELESADILHAIYRDLKVERGDVVCLGIDMSGIPLPKYPFKPVPELIRARSDKLCRFLLESILEYLGPSGTALAPAYSYSCARPGSIYIHEETPSEVGPFTEFFRTDARAIRSIHPLFSMSGIGPHAREILTENGKSAFGPFSCFGKFRDFNVKFLCLGVSFAKSVTYLHKLEQVYGCAHRYHKSLDTKVMVNCEELPGPWTAYLRYLSLDHRADFHLMETSLRKEGVLQEVAYNGMPFHCANVADVDRVGFALLDQNPCAFTSHDVIVKLDESKTGKNPKGTPVVELETHFVR